MQNVEFLPEEEEEEVFFFLLLDLFFSLLFPCSLDDFLPSSRDLFGDYFNHIPFSICFVKENFQEQCRNFDTTKMILTCSLFDVAFSRETMRKPLNMLEFCTCIKRYQCGHSLPDEHTYYK